MQVDCASAESVIRAIEHGWGTHPAPHQDPFRRWALELNQHGYLTDRDDELQILEHCRRFRLPVADVLTELDVKIRHSGYRGGVLSVADCNIAKSECFVFFDSLRFKNTKEISNLLDALRHGLRPSQI